MALLIFIYLLGAVLTYGLAYGTQRATWPEMNSALHLLVALFFALFSLIGLVAVCGANLTTSDVRWAMRWRFDHPPQEKEVSDG